MQELLVPGGESEDELALIEPRDFRQFAWRRCRAPAADLLLEALSAARGGVRSRCSLRDASSRFPEFTDGSSWRRASPPDYAPG